MYKIEKNLITNLKKARTPLSVQKAFFDTLIKKKLRFKTGCRINIAIINLICGGFGDIIFCYKLVVLLKKFSKYIDITIFGINDKIRTLGLDKKARIVLSSKSNECMLPSVSKYPAKERSEFFDMYFVAPVIDDFDPKKVTKSVVSSFEHATFLNTFLFSEYNSGFKKDFFFPMGLGTDYFGIFDRIKIKGKHAKSEITKIIKTKYVVCYIADHKSGYKKCFENFCLMILEKYKSNKKFSFVLPDWIYESYFDDRFINKLEKYYGTITCVFKDEIITELESDKKDRELIFRFDLMPCSYKQMNSYIAYSEKDILVTGDQSLSDAVSYNKNIYYQILPWKAKLAKELGKIIGKDVGLKSSSCGCSHGKTKQRSGNMNILVFNDSILRRLLSVFCELQVNDDLYELYMSLSRMKKITSKKKILEEYDI